MGQAQTYGLPEDEEVTSPALAGQPPEITGQPAVDGSLPPSGPVGSDNNAPNVNTPVAGDAPQTQPAGPDFTKDQGPPGDIVANGTRKDADGQLKTGQQTSEAITNTRGNSNGQSNLQGQLLNENLKENGVNVPKSFQEIQDEIYKTLTREKEDKKITAAKEKSLRKGWRKVFNHVHEDEMGLFLIDFGMRAMMAGETMGDMGAIGAAGSGALGALQGRRQKADDDELAMQQTSHDMTTERMDTESKRMTAEAAGKTADAAVTRAGALGAGYQGKDKFLMDFYREQGRSDEWIAQQLSGAKSYEESFDIIAEGVEAAYEKAAADAPIGGSTIGAVMVTLDKEERMLHTLKPKERARLAENIARERMAARKSGASGEAEETAYERALSGSKE